MTDLETRARAAGNALRSWAPDTTPASTDALATRAVRRARVRRAGAGTLAAAVLAGVGLVWGTSVDHNDVEIGPDTKVTSDVPTPTTVDQAATTDPADTATTAATTTAPPAEAPAPTTCTAHVGDSVVTVEVTLPVGWHTNEANHGVPTCYHFGPEPVTISLGESESGTGIVSNAVVWFYTPHPAGQLPSSFEDDVALSERPGVTVVTDVRRAIVDGHAAARFELIAAPGDDYQGGDPYVRWQIDLGDIWLEATMTLPQDLPEGITHEQAVASFDQIMTGLRFS